MSILILRAEAKVDEESSIQLLRNMLEIYSTSGKEEELAKFLEKELESLGFKVWKDRAGNVYGEVGSGSPTILLCGHIDTVPGWIPVNIQANRLYGRGAVDAKASLAAMITAASSFKHETEKGRVIIAAVVEEERKARGIRQLVREGLKVDYAIFGEPSGVRNIAFAYKGKVGLRIQCKTVSGHIGAQHLVDNAIEKSFELWNMLRDSCQSYQSPHGVFYSLIPCLTRITSRRTSGGVPDFCIMDIDLRLPPTVKSKECLTIVQNVAKDFQTSNQSVSIFLKVTDRVDPFIAKRTTPLMDALGKAILEVTGEPMKFLRKTGTSDMNIFGAKFNIPVAVYGPGDARLSHTRLEYIDIPEYLASIKVYKRVIDQIFSLNMNDPIKLKA